MDWRTRPLLLALALSLPACLPMGQATPGARQARSGGVTSASIERGLQLLLGYRDVDGQVMGQAADTEVTAVVVFASWCRYCRRELAVLNELSSADARLRIIGVNYYEKDDGTRLRAYLAQQAPWLRVVRADRPLFNAFGRPSHVPSLYLFDRGGRLLSAYVPPRRKPPTMDELRARITDLLSRS